MSITTNLRTARKNLGLTQVNAAKLCKVHAGTITFIETNRCTPATSTAIKLAKGLGITLDQVLGLAEVKPFVKCSHCGGSGLVAPTDHPGLDAALSRDVDSLPPPRNRVMISP